MIAARLLRLRPTASGGVISCGGRSAEDTIPLAWEPGVPPACLPGSPAPQSAHVPPEHPGADRLSSGPGLHGGGLRMYYNVKFLASRHRVTLISFIEHENERGLLQKLEPLGVEVRAVPRRPAHCAAPVDAPAGRALRVPAPPWPPRSVGCWRAGASTSSRPNISRWPSMFPGRPPGVPSSPSTKCSTPTLPGPSGGPAIPGPGPGGGTTGWCSSTTRSGPAPASMRWSA